MKKIILALALLVFVCNIGFAAKLNFTEEKLAPANVKELAGQEKVKTHKINISDPGLILQGGDDVESATVIESLDYSNSGTTSGYTDDYHEVCPYDYPGSPDVVYSFTPDADMWISIDLYGSSYDTQVYVYENSVTPGEPIACNEDYYSDYSSFIASVALTATNTYYIVIDGYDGDSGDYSLAITDIGEPTIGDGCDNPFVIEELPYSDNGYSCDYIDDCDIYGLDGPDVIYEMTVESLTRLTVSLLGSDYDTKLAIYQTDCCSGAGYEYAYNDDYGDTYQSEITTFFTPATYYVVVEGYYGDCGNYVLNIGEAAEPGTPSCTQNYIGPDDDDWVFQTSDTELGPYLVYEDFSCEDYTCINGVTFWGLQLYSDGSYWYNCTEDPTEMTIMFYDDINYIPDFDNPNYTIEVQPEITATGIYYSDVYELLKYEVTFEDCIPVNSGWISIQGTLNDGQGCAFLWSGSADGNSYSYQDQDGSIVELECDLSLLFDGYTDIEDNTEALPASIDMVTNYPNPFNPTTTFAFTLANSGNVAINIYDVLGRRIDNLDLGYLDNKQVHSVDYNASHLATGMYFYSLSVDGVKKVAESFSLLK